MLPVWSTRRTWQFSVSAMYRRPSSSSAIPSGRYRLASVADPPFPPPPATVAMVSGIPRAACSAERVAAAGTEGDGNGSGRGAPLGRTTTAPCMPSMTCGLQKYPYTPDWSNVRTNVSPHTILSEENSPS